MKKNKTEEKINKCWDKVAKKWGIEKFKDFYGLDKYVVFRKSLFYGKFRFHKNECDSLEEAESILITRITEEAETKYYNEYVTYTEQK